MSIALPTYQGSVTTWQLSDFLRRRVRTSAAASGSASLELEQLDSDELWLIDHMVSYCYSTTTTTMRLYESTVDPMYVLDGAAKGNFNVGSWTAGLQVAPSSSLVAVWTGASDGAHGVLTLQGRILRRSS